MSLNKTGLAAPPEGRPEYAHMFQYWMYQHQALVLLIDGIGSPCFLARKYVDKFWNGDFVGRNMGAV